MMAKTWEKERRFTLEDAIKSFSYTASAGRYYVFVRGDEANRYDIRVKSGEGLTDSLP